MNKIEIEKRIEKAKIISFDIFDTLIVRCYDKPMDLFRHLEEGKKASGFAMARVLAERSVRERATSHGINEISLEDIYKELHASYQSIMQDEIDLEKKACFANLEMQEIFLFAKQLNKVIVISSDMYLPQSLIEEILHNNGYDGYNKIFLSSTTKHPKATGEMYDDIIQTFDVSPNQILHIGDHPVTDFSIPKQKGVNAFCYEPIRQSIGNNLNSGYFAVLNEYVQTQSAASIIKGLITRYMGTHSNNDYWVNFGYKFIGPLVFSYMEWLKERLEQCQIDKVYFMLRDGYIMKRVFDLIYPDFKTQEIYGSRRLFLLAGMSSFKDVREVLTDLYMKNITFAELWEVLGIKSEQFRTAYLQAFPFQCKKILSDGDFERLNIFMQENNDLLLEEGMSERACLEGYLQSIGLFDGTCGVVDLGWKGSMLKSLDGICKSLNRPADLIGFYLGTHDCQTPNLRIESYLLDHGNTTGARNADALKDYGYAVPILELAFSAPHCSIIGVKRTDRGYEPIYQKSNEYEERRIAICKMILEGVLDFVKDLCQLTSEIPIKIAKELALAPIEYFSNYIDKYDQAKLEEVFCCYGRGNHSCYRPIFKTGTPVMGIINPWPGDQSAEAEVLTRFKRAAEENNIECIMLDNFGHVLDNEQHMTNVLVDEERLSFVLTTHYETPKILNAFYYHALWNPPEIPLNLDYYTKRVTDNYIMNDDFLMYDSGGMSNHLRSMLMNCPRTLEGASSLTASFPASAMLTPSLDNPMMFYCGMNWEKVVHGTNRHEGLFKLLDNTKKVKFFGPERVEAWGGLKPWEGYACYQYSIPFDGFSILKEINSCGICLVLSSDIHRRAGAATNRTYEACAAGAVIISDDNPFMLEHFKDAALFIVYNKDNPADTFRQIMEKYDWIVSHREEALALAKRAQEIFVEKFSLDIQFNKIVANHPKRVEQIEKDLFAQDYKGKVLVTHVLDTNDVSEAEKRLNRVIQNVHQQFYPNIEVAVGADFVIAEAVQSFTSANGACVRVFPMEIFDQKGTRKMTNGQAIRKMQRQVDHEYYMNAGDCEVWYSDHITTLIRAIENSGAICGYSGTSFEDDKKYRRIEFFDILNLNHLFSMKEPQQGLTPGQFLFTAKAHTMLPDYLFDCLDGREHYAYASVLHYKFGEKLTFTRRMSLCFARSEKERSFVLPIEMQNRFIQDLVRFHLPEQSNLAMMEQLNEQTAGSVPTKRSLTDMLLMIPLKSMILLRYYRFRMRRLNPKSDKYYKFDKKYSAVLRQYNEYWGN